MDMIIVNTFANIKRLEIKKRRLIFDWTEVALSKRIRQKNELAAEFEDSMELDYTRLPLLYSLVYSESYIINEILVQILLLLFNHI